MLLLLDKARIFCTANSLNGTNVFCWHCKLQCLTKIKGKKKIHLSQSTLSMHYNDTSVPLLPVFVLITSEMTGQLAQEKEIVYLQDCFSTASMTFSITSSSSPSLVDWKASVRYFRASLIPEKKAQKAN